MNTPTPAEIVDAMHAAFRARDLDAITRHWSDDVHYLAPGVELHGKAARLEAEKVWLNAFTENEVRTVQRFVDGDSIVDFAIMSGVQTGAMALPGGGELPATGHRISGPYVARYRIEDGKVAFQEVVYDRLALMQQLGGAPS